jgi:hypothetical protein
MVTGQSDSEKARVFTKHLSEVFTSSKEVNKQEARKIKAALNEVHQLDLPTKSFLIKELETPFGKLTPKKHLVMT